MCGANPQNGVITRTTVERCLAALYGESGGGRVGRWGAGDTPHSLLKAIIYVVYVESVECLFVSVLEFPRVGGSGGAVVDNTSLCFSSSNLFQLSRRKYLS